MLTHAQSGTTSGILLMKVVGTGIPIMVGFLITSQAFNW